MAAPALVGSASSGSTSGASITITLTGSGITNGNSVIVAVCLPGVATRTFAVTDSNSNVWGAAIISYNPGRGVYQFLLPVAAGLSGGAATVTITINTGTATFTAEVQEVTPIVSASITDTIDEGVASGTHTSATTGVTSGTEVLAVCVGQLNAAATSTVVGTNYVRIGSAQTNRMVQALSSAAALSGHVGQWTSTGTNRTNTGCIAVYQNAVTYRYLLVRN